MESNKSINVGLILKSPINEFNKISQIKSKKEITEIILKLKMGEVDLGYLLGKDKEIKLYFLDNTKFYDLHEEHFHDNLKELNKENTKIYINNEEYDYCKYIPTKKVDELFEIRIKINFKMKDFSFMFCSCVHIIDMNLSSFDTLEVINMNHMFCNLMHIDNLDLSSFDTHNVSYMSFLFQKVNL